MRRKLDENWGNRAIDKLARKSQTILKKVSIVKIDYSEENSNLSLEIPLNIAHNSQYEGFAQNEVASLNAWMTEKDQYTAVHFQVKSKIQRKSCE